MKIYLIDPDKDSEKLIRKIAEATAPEETSQDAYREALQSTITDCEEQSDKSIPYISGGAIGLSLAFMASDLFQLTALRGLLIAGIVLEIVALLLNLWSFLYTKRVCRREMKVLDNWDPLKGSTPDCYAMALEQARKIDRYNRNNIIILIAGIVLLTLFATCNMGKTAPEAQQSPTCCECSADINPTNK